MLERLVGAPGLEQQAGEAAAQVGVAGVPGDGARQLLGGAREVAGGVALERVLERPRPGRLAPGLE